MTYKSHNRYENDRIVYESMKGKKLME